MLCGLFARAGDTGDRGQRGGTTAVCAHSERRGSVHPRLHVWFHGESDERNRDTKVQRVRGHSVHVHTPSCREVAVHTLCDDVRRHTMGTEQRGRHPPIAKLPVGRTCIDDTHGGKGSYPVLSQDTGANHTPSVSVHTEGYVCTVGAGVGDSSVLSVTVVVCEAIAYRDGTRVWENRAGSTWTSSSGKERR